MNPEKQRIAIAEACGWTQLQEPDPEFGRTDNPKPDDLIGIPPEKNGHIWVPDYTKDLNAINEVLRSMESRYWSPFLRALIKITKTEPDPNSLTSIMLQVTATADQLSEAYLKAIGKWEDS